MLQYIYTKIDQIYIVNSLFKTLINENVSVDIE
jgi:hypothetical protein